MKKLLLIVIMIGYVVAQNTVLKQFSDQFADIAEKANPAVVTIFTEKNIDLSQYHRNAPQVTIYSGFSSNNHNVNSNLLPLVPA